MEHVLGAFKLAFLWHSPNVLEHKTERILKKISEREGMQECVLNFFKNYFQ